MNLNQHSITFPTVYNMSMFGEINDFDFCHLSSDVIVRPKYAPDTLTKRPMHPQINSQHFERKRKSNHFSFRSSTVTNKHTYIQTNMYIILIIRTSISTRHSIQYRIKLTALLTLPVSLYISRGMHFQTLFLM